MKYTTMKKFIFTFVFAASLFANSASAQFANRNSEQTSASAFAGSDLRDMILDPEFHSAWMIGVYGGIDYNMHYGGFSTTEGSIICCVANDGKGIGAAIGLKAFIPLSDALMISPRIVYEGRNGTFTANPESYPILGQNNTVENLILTKQFKATMSTIGADLFLTWNLTESGLYITGGPSVASITSQRFVQTESISSPSGVKYLNNNAPDQEVLNSDLDITKSLQVLAKIGAGYRISLSSQFTLNPEVLYGIPLTKLSKTYGWTASALQGTLGLLYTL
jgi:hypothetical protein